MRTETNGLSMIAASLVVIAAVIALVAQHEVDLRREQVRSQGISLTSAMSRIPLERLVPTDNRLGPLPLLKTSQATSLFAYVVIVDANGTRLADATVSGVRVPAIDPPQDPSSWIAERIVSMDEGGAAIREFSAPVLAGGELVGHVRIGFVEPSIGIVLRDASFHGAVALIVFLLMPLSYLWLRRAMRPLNAAASRLEAVEDDAAASVGSAVSAPAVEDFLKRFETFIEFSSARTESLRRERTQLLASSKVLSHQKARIEALLEALPDAAVALDDAGVTTFANARLESLLGVRREDVVGRAPEEWSPHPAVVEFLGRYGGSLGGRMRSDSLEFAPERGEDTRVAVSAHPLTSGAGTLVVFRDVTAATLARKTQAEFLGHMAHELKAPLTVLSGYAELLHGDRGRDESFRMEASNVLQDEIERLDNLINTLFSIARIESGNVSVERQRIRLGDLLSDVVQTMARGDGDERVKLDLEVPKHLSAVFADKALLSVALNNLLSNALKYNRDDGSVVVSAEEDDQEIAIRVRDSGVGIPEEDLGRIFEKFYRSEHESACKKPGHGLGLSLVKEIAAVHGGEIQVRSELGEGSEFSLVFRKNSALFQEPE